MRGARFRHQPPWWPAGEPWPSRHEPRWRRGRRRFLARIALVFVVILSLSAYGAVTLVRRLIGGAGMAPASSPAWIWVVVLFLAVGFFAVMRLVGRPLSEVVGASERVAAGDFAVRVSEHGPPSLRSVASAFNSMTTRLEAQQHARRELMADIAHELRTPLSAMQGQLEGMIDGVYPRDTLQVARVLDDTRMLARLVEDLRTLAHSESGTLALAKESTDLGALVTETVAIFQPEAQANHVGLVVHLAGDLPNVDLDPVRIREVLINLLSNAVRHTPNGSTVSVQANRLPSAVRIVVNDQGEGISAEALPHIFDRFYKGHGSTGSGLGLTIARNLVMAHGGTIAARANADRGTTVEFELPATDAASAD